MMTALSPATLERGIYSSRGLVSPTEKRQSDAIQRLVGRLRVLVDDLQASPAAAIDCSCWVQVDSALRALHVSLIELQETVGDRRDDHDPARVSLQAAGPYRRL